MGWEGRLRRGRAGLKRGPRASSALRLPVHEQAKATAIRLGRNALVDKGAGCGNPAKRPIVLEGITVMCKKENDNDID